jgi:hydroxyacylglutathione hydrolase
VLRRGEVVVDTRPSAAFAAGHAPGTINIPLDANFTTWAGWLLPYDRDVYLLVDDKCAHCPATAVRDLATIGLDRVAAVFGDDALAAWTAAGGELDTVQQATVAEVSAMLDRGDASIVDVRGRAEWEAGHIPGVPNVPLGRLPERLTELPADRPIVVQCQGGARSAIAASVLLARGVRNVVNMTGGFAAWQQAGLPVAHGTEESGAPADLAAVTSPMQTS